MRRIVKKVSAIILAAVVATTICVTSFANETVYGSFTYNGITCDGYGGNEITEKQYYYSVDFYTSAAARYNSSMTFYRVALVWDKQYTDSGNPFGSGPRIVEENDTKRVTGNDTFATAYHLSVFATHIVDDAANDNYHLFEDYTVSYS